MIIGFASHEPLFRSAGCQPAVSPIANRRGVGTANGQRVGNPRYSAARPSRNQNGNSRIAATCRRGGAPEKSSRSTSILGDTDREMVGDGMAGRTRDNVWHTV